MRSLLYLGILLVLLGVGGIAVNHFSYTETKPVLKAGPVQVNSEQEHYFSIPLAGSIIVLAAGMVLIIMGRRQA